LPKAKADQVIVHRIELQETERDALEMIAASITARNVSQSINNVITPFTQASIAGLSFALSLTAAFGVAREAHKSGLVEPEDIPPFFFGVIPGSVAYGIRNINWANVRNEFDKRMRDYNPPQI
jgi:hypothetical protein